MNTLTVSQLLKLRELISATSISDVLDGVAELCREKSCHVKTEYLRSELQQVSGILVKTAEQPIVKYLPNVI